MDGVHKGKERRKQASVRRWRWAGLLLTMLGFGIGCNPFALTGYILQSFVPQTIPPRCKLSKDKEVIVAIAVFNGYLEQRPEYQGLETEFSERLGAAMKKRFDANRERVKIVPAARVQAYLNQSARRLDQQELGKHFDADYVLALEIEHVSMYGGSRLLYRGDLLVDVTVLDVHQPKGEGTLFEEKFHCQFPKDNPMDASGSSLGEFRRLFLGKAAQQLSRWFTAYAAEEKMQHDE